MTPEQLAALVVKALNATLMMLGLVQSLESKKAAQENVPYTIETTLAVLDSYSRNSPTGFPAVLDAISLVRLDTSSPHLATLTDVLDAIAASPLVTLPTVPPPGYGFNGLVEVPQMCGFD